MAKGRKPKPDAQRRGGHSADGGAVALEARVADGAPASLGPAKPAHVAVNATMSECWDNLIGAAPFLTQQDAPLMESYCYWYAVFRQALESTMTLDGRVVTLVAKKDDDGMTDPSTVRANPELRTAEKATEMLRKIGDALNISPTARIRTGIMAAMAASTVDDLARKTDEGYRRFKAAQAKGALPE